MTEQQTTDDVAVTQEHPLSAVTAAFNKIEQGTLTDRAYLALRTSILSGHLPTHAQLREVDLAEVIPVSRTPIREALTRLVSQGLVTVGANRVLEVREVDLQGCLNTYEILAALEPLAVKLAAQNASREQITRLQNSLTLKEFFYQNFRWEEVTRESQVFHEIIYEASGNPELANVIRRLREDTHRFRRLYIRTRATAVEAIEQDKQIVDLVSQRDDEGAYEVMVKHIRISITALESMMENDLTLDEYIEQAEILDRKTGEGDNREADHI